MKMLAAKSQLPTTNAHLARTVSKLIDDLCAASRLQWPEPVTPAGIALHGASSLTWLAMPREVSENVTTLASYEAAADQYVAHQPPTAPAALLTFVDAIAELLPNGGRVLEIGSATGQDATLLEARGLRVCRTDATVGFVNRLRAHGVEAEILNVLTDELGGPWDGIFANAVFVHLNVYELAGVLAKTARSVTPGGILGFTVKEGDGAALVHCQAQPSPAFHLLASSFAASDGRLIAMGPDRARPCRRRQGRLVVLPLRYADRSIAGRSGEAKTIDRPIASRTPALPAERGSSHPPT
jgi:SAM-dependent methyltransferase